MENLGQTTIELIFGFIALLFAAKILGKTQISQLTPFDFISAMVLGELVGNSVYDDNIKIWSILYALFLWTVLIFTVEKLTQKFRRLRKTFEGNPSIIIRKGKIDREQLSSNHLDIDQLQQMLRQQRDIFSIREVEYMILEPNGQISVMRKAKYASPTVEDLSVKQKPAYLPITLISDGKVVPDNLREAGYDEEWLLKQLKKRDITRFEDALYAEWVEDDGFFCLKMNGQ
ncbi:YetF domain-containing protein [Ureibacillus sp. GCM10028918]|uniref:YetF domain-containing protein n=1 Tax=Ureibacillus sp. GCM10028918 TaxID=3273429 RepID=UPI003613337D